MRHCFLRLYDPIHVSTNPQNFKVIPTVYAFYRVIQKETPPAAIETNKFVPLPMSDSHDLPIIHWSTLVSSLPSIIFDTEWLACILISWRRR